MLCGRLEFISLKSLLYRGKWKRGRLVSASTICSKSALNVPRAAPAKTKKVPRTDRVPTSCSYLTSLWFPLLRPRNSPGEELSPFKPSYGDTPRVALCLQRRPLPVRSSPGGARCERSSVTVAHGAALWPCRVLSAVGAAGRRLPRCGLRWGVGSRRTRRRL